MNQFQYDNRDKIDMERAKFILMFKILFINLNKCRWMLRTSSEKLKIINRNEELENAYNRKKSIFKKPGKIDEFFNFQFFLFKFIIVQ